MSEFDAGTPLGATVVVDGQHGSDDPADLPGCPPSERDPAIRPTPTVEPVRRVTSKTACLWRRLIRLFTT
jgi:hypothetical protein